MSRAMSLKTCSLQNAESVEELKKTKKLNIGNSHIYLNRGMYMIVYMYDMHRYTQWTDTYILRESIVIKTRFVGDVFLGEAWL